MKWKLRKAALSDLESIVRIDRVSHAIPWPQEALRDCITGREAVLILVCRHNMPGAPAGFAAGRFLSGEFEILNIAVTPKRRNRGLGHLLMDGLREEAIRRGCHTWILEVREGNLAARHLYESFGLVEVGKRRGYYADTGEAAILMAGRLSGDLEE